MLMYTGYDELKQSMLMKSKVVKDIIPSKYIDAHRSSMLILEGLPFVYLNKFSKVNCPNVLAVKMQELSERSLNLFVPFLEKNVYMVLIVSNLEATDMEANLSKFPQLCFFNVLRNQHEFMDKYEGEIKVTYMEEPNDPVLISVSNQSLEESLK